MTTADDELTLPGMPEPDVDERQELADALSGELDQLAVQLPCTTCGAAADHWCRTRSGHGAARLHAARLLIVQAIYWRGFERGRAARE